MSKKGTDSLNVTVTNRAVKFRLIPTRVSHEGVPVLRVLQCNHRVPRVDTVAHPDEDFTTRGARRTEYSWSYRRFREQRLRGRGMKQRIGIGLAGKVVDGKFIPDSASFIYPPVDPNCVIDIDIADEILGIDSSELNSPKADPLE